MLVICVFSAFQGLYCMDLISRNADDYAVYYDFTPNLNLSRIASSGEYLLADTNTNLTWIDLDLTGQNIQTELMARKGTSMEVTCRATTDAWLELPLFAYRYYRCTDVETLESFPITFN